MLTQRRSKGFSLIELAMGLVIVATMLSALLVPLASQIDQRRTAETEKLLVEARDALIGFAISQGRFPCPAVYVDDTSRGVEDFSDQPNGTCTQFRGYLPAATLGLSPLDRYGYLVDGYGGDPNRIHYSIAKHDLASGKQLFTVSGEMKTFGIGSLGTTKQWQSICSTKSNDNTDCSAGVTLAEDIAIAVIWSAGNYTSGRSDDENENLSTDNGNRIFVSRTRSDLAGSEFDDLLLWISPSILIGRMVAAGTLP